MTQELFDPLYHHLMENDDVLVETSDPKQIIDAINRYNLLTKKAIALFWKYVTPEMLETAQELTNKGISKFYAHAYFEITYLRAFGEFIELRASVHGSGNTFEIPISEFTRTLKDITDERERAMEEARQQWKK